MTLQELEQERKTSKKEYDVTVSNIELMEQTIEIQNYLKEQEKKKDQEEYQKFINNLKVGEDGTIFGPVSNDRYATILLSEFIQYALSLKYYDKNSKENCCCEVSYTQLIEYEKNAMKILKEMIGYPDDEYLENPYNLEIYRNPREIKFCSESALLNNCFFVPNEYSLSDELSSRGMKEVIVTEDEKIVLIDAWIKGKYHRGFSNFEPIDIKSLRIREQNAFFGQEAQRILGVKLEDPLFSNFQEEGTIKKAPYTK